MNKEIVTGKMIGYLLKENKMTMKQLGERLGKKESTVSKWVSGSSTPLAKDLSAMTEIFNVDISTLLYGTSSQVDSDSVRLIEMVTKLEDSRKKNVYVYVEKQLEEQEELKKRREYTSGLMDQAIELYGIEAVENIQKIIENQMDLEDKDETAT